MRGFDSHTSNTTPEPAYKLGDTLTAGKTAIKMDSGIDYWQAGKTATF
jgi:hypothetical protein